MGGSPSFTIPILVAPEPYSGSEVEGRNLSFSSKRRSAHFGYEKPPFPPPTRGQKRRCRDVDIIANEADRADGGVIPVSAFALEFRED
jgi:hypothetical protein